MSSVHVVWGRISSSPFHAGVLEHVSIRYSNIPTRLDYMVCVIAGNLTGCYGGNLASRLNFHGFVSILLLDTLVIVVCSRSINDENPHCL